MRSPCTSSSCCAARSALMWPAGRRIAACLRPHPCERRRCAALQYHSKRTCQQLHGGVRGVLQVYAACLGGMRGQAFGAVYLAGKHGPGGMPAEFGWWGHTAVRGFCWEFGRTSHDLWNLRCALQAADPWSVVCAGILTHWYVSATDPKVPPMTVPVWGPTVLPEWQHTWQAVGQALTIGSALQAM